jgi:hypothetical protein
LKHFSKNRKAITTGAAAVLITTILVIAALAGAYMYSKGYLSPPSSPSPSSPPSGGNGNNITPSTYAGPLLLSIVDEVTGTAFDTATTTIDQVVANGNGVFNFISGQHNSVAYSVTTPQSAVMIVNQGSQVIVMVDCTGAASNGIAGYYPAMYYFNAEPGASIYYLGSAQCFTQVTANPYTYSINTQYATLMPQTVTEYQSSNVYYWNIGNLALYPRDAAAGLNEILSYNGASLASVNDASAWVNTNATITANCTLLSVSNEKLTLQVATDNPNLCWGQQYFVIGSTGAVYNYGAVCVFSTQMINIGQAALQNAGFIPLSMSNLYNEKAFYEVLNPTQPLKGQSLGFSIQVPIDSSSATPSTAYRYSFWLNDCQNLGTVGVAGNSAAMPTAYGFVTAYGPAACVQSVVLTISGGQSATPQLMDWVTTHS